MKKLVFLCFFLLLFPKNVLAIENSATSSIVMDLDSGRIFEQKDSNTERLIASTTNIMTT